MRQSFTLLSPGAGLLSIDRPDVRRVGELQHFLQLELGIDLVRARVGHQEGPAYRG